MRRLRIATYNIHKCRGLDWRTSVSRIGDVLHEIEADLLGLQEVVGIGAGTLERDQAQYLASALGFHCALGTNRELDGAAYGNVVLSRWRPHSVCNYDISVPGRERRGCLRTDILLPGGPALHLFNVHLGTAFLERRDQARRLLAAELLCSSEFSGPRVIVGDFNEWTRGLVSRSLANEFSGADIRARLHGRRTYPGIFPLLHLDHIYYDARLELEAVFLHRSRKALVASDHLPLVADFRLSS